MTKIVHVVLVVLAFSNWLVAAEDAPDPLPAPVTNNAVAMLKTGRQLFLFSMMGLGPKKTWNSVTNAAYQMDASTGKWAEINSVPGPVGRIGAVAVGARDHVFLFGGYVLDGQGGEATVPDVNVFEPITGHWLRGADIPVPVDDSIAGAYDDRYIYLVSGWSKTDPVNNVQVYDGKTNTWDQATPIPGTPVFGHAGALVGDTIVYCDGAYKNPAGAKPKYIASDECWMGKIDHRDLTKIKWTKLPAHPGTARYRIAAGGSEKDQRIYFSGGTDNPYNYTGIGYDGKPAEPSLVTFAFNLKTGKWETVTSDTTDATMDHRGLPVTPGALVVIGGMEKGQQVTAKVTVLSRK